MLFMYLTIRAIHIELTPAMYSDAFILTCRCIALRGELEGFYCNNGTNFRGTSNELKEMMIENLCRLRFELYSSIVFRFNLPCVPDIGGALERLVRSLTINFNNAVGEQTLTQHMLRAVLSEI